MFLLLENATVFHNCTSFIHLSSRTHTCSVFTLGFTLKLRVNSLGSVYFFGYWICFEKNKTICILIFHFCSDHWKQKVTKNSLWYRYKNTHIKDIELDSVNWIRTSILKLVLKFLFFLWHVNYAAEVRRADWLAAWSLTSNLYSLWKQCAGFIAENRLNGKSCGDVTTASCTLCSWEQHRISVRGTCKGGVLWRFLSEMLC